MIIIIFSTSHIIFTINRRNFIKLLAKQINEFPNNIIDFKYN